MHGNFGNIDAMYCESEVTNGAKLMFKTQRAFRDDPEMKAICSIAEQIRKELLDFQPNVPIYVGSNSTTKVSKYLTLNGSFSAVSKPNFARKYSLELAICSKRRLRKGTWESSCRDLQDLHAFGPLGPQYSRKCSSNFFRIFGKLHQTSLLSKNQ